ncbi:MAG: glutaredoxin 3 [Gammaproteobacteria bacterium]
MSFSDFVVNNWPLFVALVIISFLLARTWIGPGALASIRPAEAVQLINHQNAVIVDVRSDKEYQEGHIVNSLHIPLGVLENRLSDLKDHKNDSLIMVCRSGTRSTSAANILKKQGFETVKNLQGGMLAWGSANLPVTTAKTKHKKTTKKSKKEKAQETLAIGHDDSHEVLVYTTRRCPFCTRAITLLEDKNIGYTEIDIGNKPDLRKEMEERAQRTSVPQIFIGDVHVGGCDDMYALEDQGKLDGLLGLALKV